MQVNKPDAIFHEVLFSPDVTRSIHTFNAYSLLDVLSEIGGVLSILILVSSLVCKPFSRHNLVLA